MAFVDNKETSMQSTDGYPSPLPSPFQLDATRLLFAHQSILALERRTHILFRSLIKANEVLHLLAATISRGAWCCAIVVHEFGISFIMLKCPMSKVNFLSRANLHCEEFKIILPDGTRCSKHSRCWGTRHKSL